MTGSDRLSLQYNHIERVAETTRRVLTSDNWFPSIDDQYVDVKCFIHAYVRRKSRTHPDWCGDATYYCRICVWGGDDTGREFDFLTENLEEARQFYQKWSQWMGQISMIDFEELRMLGFSPA